MYYDSVPVVSIFEKRKFINKIIKSTDHLPRPHKLVKLRYQMANTVLTFFQMSDFQRIVFGQIYGYCISDHVKAFTVCGTKGSRRQGPAF